MCIYVIRVYTCVYTYFKYICLKKISKNLSHHLHMFLSNQFCVAQSSCGPPYLAAFLRVRSAPSDWGSSWCTRSPGIPQQSCRRAETPIHAETTNGKHRIAFGLSLSRFKIYIVYRIIELLINSPGVLMIVPDFPARTPSRSSPRLWTRFAMNVCWNRCSTWTAAAASSLSLHDPPTNYLARMDYARK